MTVYAAISSQPDWIDILEIVFNSQTSARWFAYLLEYGSKTSPRMVYLHFAST